MKSNEFQRPAKVLILAPTAKDAETTAGILSDQGVDTIICRDLKAICGSITEEIGAAILTAEFLLADRENLLRRTLESQPAWSDLPLIVLVPGGREAQASVEILEAIGNMTLIARPVQISTLISHVQAALRDRERQYRLRDYLQEREAQTEAIAQANEYLELMMESAKEFAILSVNPQGKITRWNDGAAHIFGYSSAEIIGQHFEIIFTPEDRQAQAPEYELSVAEKEGRASDERWHMRKNEERFYASGITAAMHDSRGHLKGFVKIARDMTEQKRTEEALVSARNAAEAANIAKTEFLANMSHEIRTPMNAVIGLSNILARSEPLTQKQTDFIKTLQMSADSLLALINDLLDIAKIEARTVQLEQVPFSLTRLAQEVASMMAVRVAEKGLVFSGDGECVRHRMFVGDPTRLKQILLNLCSNAVKFTDHGGIHLSVTCEPLDDPDYEMITISVKDSGIGIEQDKLATIFEKFVQADTSINRKYGGTGLGLAITKTLTEIMGGKISVESEAGSGSNFIVTIPLKLAEDQTIQEYDGSLPELFAKSKPVSNVRVLLVEDYQPNVIVASTFLEQFGFECDIASNGLEAVEKVRSNTYAAALMDVQMHGMNGLEATTLIREYERQKNCAQLPIIGMTAHALSGDRERCLAVGMNDYISKPFNPDELESLLRKYTKAA